MLTKTFQITCRLQRNIHKLVDLSRLQNGYALAAILSAMEIKPLSGYYFEEVTTIANALS